MLLSRHQSKGVVAGGTVSELTRRSEVLRLLRLIPPQTHRPAGVAQTSMTYIRIPRGVVELIHVLHRLESQRQGIGISGESPHGNAPAASRALLGRPRTHHAVATGPLEARIALAHAFGAVAHSVVGALHLAVSGAAGSVAEREQIAYGLAHWAARKRLARWVAVNNKEAIITVNTC